MQHMPALGHVPRSLTVISAPVISPRAKPGSCASAPRICASPKAAPVSSGPCRHRRRSDVSTKAGPVSRPCRWSGTWVTWRGGADTELPRQAPCSAVPELSLARAKTPHATHGQGFSAAAVVLRGRHIYPGSTKRGLRLSGRWGVPRPTRTARVGSIFPGAASQSSRSSDGSTQLSLRQFR
jgi:hypothetical protein